MIGIKKTAYFVGGDGGGSRGCGIVGTGNGETIYSVSKETTTGNEGRIGRSIIGFVGRESGGAGFGYGEVIYIYRRSGSIG